MTLLETYRPSLDDYAVKGEAKAGLKLLRQGAWDRSGPRYHCANCKKNRYSPCGCEEAKR